MSIENCTVNQRPNVDFTAIHAAMVAEPTLLHPSLAELQASYQAGMSVVAWDDQRQQVAGHVRFTPLLTAELAGRLGLPANFPEVWEIGSGLMVDDPVYRGNGYYADVRNHLLAQVAERINQDLLVIGTTKHRGVLRALRHAQDLVPPINFHACWHLDFPMIAPLTCTCSGEFGQGRQLGLHCPARVASTDKVAEIMLTPVDRQGTPKIPCTMYVSSERFALEVNNKMRDHFGNSEAMIDRLRLEGYYQ